jgi:hypothetical protein
MFIIRYSIDPSSVREAAEPFEYELTPLIAIVIRNEYENNDQFFSYSVGALTNHCNKYLTYGQTFKKVTIMSQIVRRFIFITLDTH